MNAVDITASASTVPSTDVTRGSGSGTTRSSARPTSSASGMTSVSSTCSPWRSARRVSSDTCVASIRPSGPRPGAGVKVLGAKRSLTIATPGP